MWYLNKIYEKTEVSLPKNGLYFFEENNFDLNKNWKKTTQISDLPRIKKNDYQ